MTSTGYVTWSFSPPAGVNSVSYVVQWNTSNHTVHNVKSYQIPGLTPGQTYNVFVTAIYGNQQLQSNTVNITVPTPTPTHTPTATATATATPTPLPPAPPGKVDIEVSNTGYVTWSFSPPPGITSVSYVVQWNSSNHTVYNKNSYQIPGLTPGSTYNVYVTAMYNQGGDLKQIKSATKTITVPGAATATPTPVPTATATPAPTATSVPLPPISISVSNTGYVSWSFSPPHGIASVSYVVQWNSSNHTVYNVNSYQIPDLTPGQSYAVSVIAMYNQGGDTKAGQVHHQDDHGAAAHGHADGDGDPDGPRRPRRHCRRHRPGP